MDPVHVTITAVLGAVGVVFVAMQVVVCVGLLRERTAPTPGRLFAGLGAAVVTHLCLYYLTGSAWVAALGVAPIVVVAALCTPRTWQPPPRAARARPGEPDSVTVQPVVLGSRSGERERGNGGEDDGRLSEREQQAWESIRRALDEP